MTRHRIAQIGENRNPKSPENRPQTRRFLQIRLLQLRRSATPFNGLAVLHGRLLTAVDSVFDAEQINPNGSIHVGHAYGRRVVLLAHRAREKAVVQAPLQPSIVLVIMEEAVLAHWTVKAQLAWCIERMPIVFS